MQTKKELRREILKLRDGLTKEERESKSHQIASQVVGQKGFVEADKVLLFASYHSEVDTTEIFRAARDFSKDIYCPKVIGKEMEFFCVQDLEELLEGYRGIKEPEARTDKRFMVKANEKVCVIMPGAVFDEEGNRIGYGGGYYDIFLKRLEESLSTENISKIAVAFACQVVETGEIEVEEHDISPNILVTENKIIEFSEPANTKKKLK